MNRRRHKRETERRRVLRAVGLFLCELKDDVQSVSYQLGNPNPAWRSGAEWALDRARQKFDRLADTGRRGP